MGDCEGGVVVLLSCHMFDKLQDDARDAKPRSSKAHEAELAAAAAAVVTSPRGASAFTKAQTQEVQLVILVGPCSRLL